MVGSNHRRGWGSCTAIIGNDLWQKSMYLVWFCLSDVNSNIGGRFQVPHWAPVPMVRSHYRRGWGPCTAIIGKGLWQKIHVLRLVLFIRYQLKSRGLVYNKPLGPSGHGMTTPSSRLGTLHSCLGQWFIKKIHVLRLVLFVRRRFKRWGSISNTTLGPSGHGMNTPSSRLGTLYRRHRQWFMTKTHVFRLVLLVRRQLKRCCLAYNTTLGPSGYDMKPSSSRLRILYSCYRQWFMIKIHVFSLILFVRRQFKHWGSISSTTLGPSGHGKKPLSSRLGTLYSHYRQWFMTKKSMYLG